MVKIPFGDQNNSGENATVLQYLYFPFEQTSAALEDKVGGQTQTTAEITDYCQSSLGRISLLLSLLYSFAHVSAVDSCRMHTF